MGIIIAVNAKGQKQRFSEMAWKLLGKDKGGWKEVGSQTIENVVENKAPNMAEGNVSVTGGQKVENKVKTAEEIAEAKRVVDADAKFNGNKAEPNETQKSEFLLALNGLTRGAIKDFLDSKDVEFDNGKLPELKQVLGNYFKWDLVEFQKQFS